MTNPIRTHYLQRPADGASGLTPPLWAVVAQTLAGDPPRLTETVVAQALPLARAQAFMRPLKGGYYARASDPAGPPAPQGWSIVAQTLLGEADAARLDEKLLLSRLTLVRARRVLAHLLGLPLGE